MRRAAAACSTAAPPAQAPFSSTFAVDCEECGAKLREPELLGMRIRRERTTLMGPFEYDRYLVDQLIRPIANLYRVTPLAVGDTPAGPPIAYVRQKKLAIKEHIRFCADEGETQELFHIQAQTWLDTGGSRYDVVDAQDGKIGLLHHVFGKSLLRVDLERAERGRRGGRGRAGALAGDGDPAPRDRLRPGHRRPDPDPLQLRHPRAAGR